MFTIESTDEAWRGSRAVLLLCFADHLGRQVRPRQRRVRREAEGLALGLLARAGVLDLLDELFAERVEGSDLVEREREDLPARGVDLENGALDGHREGLVGFAGLDAAGK